MNTILSFKLKKAILKLNICEEEKVDYFLGKYIEYLNKDYWLNIDGNKIHLLTIFPQTKFF